MSDTAAAGVAHRSITAANELGFDIESLLGQYGLNCKANVAHDCHCAPADNAGMVSRGSESDEKRAFIRRVKLARAARYPTQGPICTILGIEQGVYKHYETRSPLPYRYIPKFVAATGIDYEWLLTGAGRGPDVSRVPPEKPRRAARRQKSRTAA